MHAIDLNDLSKHWTGVAHVSMYVGTCVCECDSISNQRNGFQKFEL